MRRFRTISRNGYCKHLARWLLSLVLSVSALPVFAEETKAQGTAAPAAANQVRGVVSSGLGELGLSQRFPDAALWLDLEDDVRTLALFWPETETPARGALIILADEGENAESGLAGTLARELASRKFAVLALGLEPPTAGLEQILERPRLAPEPEEQTPDAASPATIDVLASDAVSEQEAAYRKRIREELVAGAAELEKREYELTGVIGIGRGSNHVVPYVTEQETPPALIWVGPKFYPHDAGQLAAILEKASVPRILELSSSSEGGQRKAGLKRAGVAGFSVQSLGSGTPFVSRDGKALAGRISAWLKFE